MLNQRANEKYALERGNGLKCRCYAAIHPIARLFDFTFTSVLRFHLSEMN